MNLNLFFRPFIKLALARRFDLIHKKKELYKNDDLEFIYNFQIQAFNDAWYNAYSNIPFYKHFKQKYLLPSSIKSLEEIEDFPETSKEVFLQHKDIIFEKGKKYQTIATGGSSGFPAHFITSKTDANNNYANTYLGRMRYRILPLDKAILFWGHSHLFGSGLSGKVKNAKRNAYDFLLNINRLSAYDLGPDTMDSYIEAIEKNNPTVIIGYTSSLFTLSKYLIDRDISLDGLKNLKGIILTSEAISEDDIYIVGRALGKNIILEYGAAETGVIAYSKPEAKKNYNVFWDSFIAQSDPNNKLLISTISDRAFPLIRYKLDDVLEDIDNSKSILAFNAIQGRKKDIFSLYDKNSNLIYMTGLVIEHVLKAIPGVHFHSFNQQQLGVLEIHLVIDEKFIFEHIVQIFNREIIKESPQISIESLRFHKLSKPIRTIAGKNKINIS